MKLKRKKKEKNYIKVKKKKFYNMEKKKQSWINIAFVAMYKTFRHS